MARANAGFHRWDVQLVGTNDATPRLAFGSRIGGLDCEQHVDIPAQPVDCRLEISASHAAGSGWEDDRGTISDDTAGFLQITFSDARASQAQSDYIQLRFVFGRPLVGRQRLI
jgi:hypothetical protein